MSKSKKEIQELESNELAGWAEKNLAEIKPYWQQIALAIALGFLIFVGIAYYLDSQKKLEAAKWQDLSTSIWNAEMTNDVSDLTFLAQEYPNHAVGMWALQLAGDYELRTGIQKLTLDRKLGMEKAAKAKGYFQQVVDSNVKKSEMLQRRSVFGLAYSAETAGDFEAAKTYYKQVIDEGEVSPFYEAATRGLQRSSNIDFVSFFDKFQSFQVAEAEEAPGEVLPDRPNIDFPDLGELSPDSGGDFSANSGMKKAAATMTVDKAPETKPEDTPETEDGSEDKSDDE